MINKWMLLSRRINGCWRRGEGEESSFSTRDKMEKWYSACARETGGLYVLKSSASGAWVLLPLCPFRPGPKCGRGAKLVTRQTYGINCAERKAGDNSLTFSTCPWLSSTMDHRGSSGSWQVGHLHQSDHLDHVDLNFRWPCHAKKRKCCYNLGNLILCNTCDLCQRKIFCCQLKWTFSKVCFGTKKNRCTHKLRNGFNNTIVTLIFLHNSMMKKLNWKYKM